MIHPGLAASYAAGVVRCDLRRPASPSVCAAQVERGMFTPSGRRGGAGHPARPATRRTRPPAASPKQLDAGDPGGSCRALEAEAAVPAARRRPAGDDLLVADGPLRGARQLPSALGYVKTHQVQYLPTALAARGGRLRAGQRCPVFLLGTRWHRYTWYLRLPGAGAARPGPAWCGVECSAELPPRRGDRARRRQRGDAAPVRSTAYKDPRAPQNLMPIAGLERRLRAMLGDPRLLHRSLRRAADARSAAGRRRRRLPRARRRWAAVAGPVDGDPGPRYDFAGTLAPLAVGRARPVRPHRRRTRSGGPAGRRTARPRCTCAGDGGGCGPPATGRARDWVIEQADAVAGLRDDLTGFAELAAAHPVVRQAWRGATVGCG